MFVEKSTKAIFLFPTTLFLCLNFFDGSLEAQEQKAASRFSVSLYSGVAFETTYWTFINN